MKKLLLLLFLLPSLVCAQGNETMNPLPDSNKSNFRVDSRNFWRTEIPKIMHRYVSRDFVVSGGLHGTAGACVSPGFSVEAFTNEGNRVTANTVSINYDAPNIGADCVNDVCWVAASSTAVPTLPFSSFERVGTTSFYANCADSTEPIWPADSARLMKVTLAGGAITQVVDLRQPMSFALSGVYDITDPLYGGKCDGVTDTTAAIQSVLAVAPAGSKIKLPGGSCIISETLAINKSLTLEGAGMDQTYIKQSVTNIPVITVSVINVNIIGMTVMHLTSPFSGGDGLIVRAPVGESLQSVNIYQVAASWNWRGFVLGCMAYAQISNVVAQKNNSHGFEFIYEDTPGCGVNQWDIFHASSSLNKGSGFFGQNTTYPFGLGPWLTQTVSFGNNQGGYVFLGSPGNPINDLRFHNNLSSADNVAGIYLDTYGSSHIISEPWIEYTGSLAGFPIGFDNTTSVVSNTGHCLGITANNTATHVTGGLYWNCSWSGIAVDAPYTSIVGGNSLGNGQALDLNLSRRAGVHIGATGVHLSGHSFTFPGTTTLFYIHLSGVINDLAIGINSYSPDLSVTNFVGSEATITAARLPALVAGTSVHTNTAFSPGLQLYDATQGANPLKLFRVNAGVLQVLNSTGAAAIHTLSDVGTPSWPSRRGQGIVTGTDSSVNIGLTPNEPDTNYFVLAMPVASAGGPATGAFTVIGVTKQTTGFELLVSTAPGVGKTVTFDWFVHR